jgi:hypothetical protein
MAALLQPHIIVIRHAVKAMHPKTFGKQQAGKVKADKACRACDKDAFHDMRFPADARNRAMRRRIATMAGFATQGVNLAGQAVGWTA